MGSQGIMDKSVIPGKQNVSSVKLANTLLN